jgi:TolB-like protein/DNA-binding winged helix-turn-helix (wHTH) protein/Flp pilus assembly protein TadD
MLYNLDDLTIDTGRQHISRGTQRLALPKLSYDLLLALVRAAPNVVSLDELMRLVWPGVIVSPETVSQRVKLLRGALGDDPRMPRYIGGLRGRGYQIIAAVSESAHTPAFSGAPPDHTAAPPTHPSLPLMDTAKLDDLTPSAADRDPLLLSAEPATKRASGSRVRRIVIALAAVVGLAIAYLVVKEDWLKKPARTLGTEVTVSRAGMDARALADDKTIAVLPFTDMSEKQDQEYFSDGLSEELIDLLTKVPGLHVPARTSSFYFKGQHTTLADIAKALSVAYVLEGSVRRAGNTIRVTAQLIRADSGYNVWSETYDRDLKDIFKVQDEIAARVVTALEVAMPLVKAATVDPTANTEAYHQYLVGRRFERLNTNADLRQAVDAFRKATTLDPNYADAFSWLGVSEVQLGDRSGDPALIEHALAMAERAVALAPRNPGGYTARGWIRYQWRWDWAGATQDLDQAEALATGFSSDRESERAILEASEGHLNEAIAILTRVAQHDPLDPYNWEDLVSLQTAVGNFQEAHVVLDRVESIEPESVDARTMRLELNLLEGAADKALADAGSFTSRFGQLWAIALSQYSLRHEHESRQALDELTKNFSSIGAFQIAEVYAWRGEKDQAFAWLERAYAQRDAGLTSIKYTPVLASLRGDPRYKSMLTKMKLPV